MLTAGFLLRNLWNLLLRRGLEFQFDRIPMRADNLSPRKIRNLFRIGWNRVFMLGKARGHPYMAHISPAGLCNLRCDYCPVYDDEQKGKGLLSFTAFQKFIDEAGDYLIYIILWGWGEPLLNPDFYRMVAYAKTKNILTVTSTNLNKFSREEAREMVSSGLDALIVALDGVTEETYARLRTGGSARRVIENTRIILEERDRAKTKTPVVNLRMVVSKENEHEVEPFRRLARSLGVDMVSFKAFSTRQKGFADAGVDERYAPENEHFRWYRYLDGFMADRKHKKYGCKFPWTKPTLFPDGTVLACEFDFRYEHVFGNINNQSFKEIWFGPKSREFRAQFKAGRDRFSFCRDCVFDYKLIPGCIVEWEILKR